MFRNSIPAVFQSKNYNTIKYFSSVVMLLHMVASSTCGLTELFSQGELSTVCLLCLFSPQDFSSLLFSSSQAAFFSFALLVGRSVADATYCGHLKAFLLFPFFLKLEKLPLSLEVIHKRY